jgi:hypothetical protein
MDVVLADLRGFLVGAASELTEAPQRGVAA